MTSTTMLSEGEATVLAMRLVDAATPLLGIPETDAIGKMFIARAEQLMKSYEPETGKE